MNRDKAIGVGLVAVGVTGILLYGWLVFFLPWRIFMLQLTAFMAVAAVLGILA
jgi:predicted DNA-binding transcriptional regulator